MGSLASSLQHRDFTLRSGGAQGADSAFEAGTSIADIYTVDYFDTYIHHTRDSMLVLRDKAFFSIDLFHPNPHAVHSKPYVRRLMARNFLQIRGHGDTPILSEFVLCWTPQASGSGGTGQALRMAKAWKIPVYDLGSPVVLSEIQQNYDAFINALTKDI
jgi:hypothetical protein